MEGVFGRTGYVIKGCTPDCSVKGEGIIQGIHKVRLYSIKKDVIDLTGGCCQLYYTKAAPL